MEQFQQEYDFVVYDMPPIIGFADSNLVAAHTDGMIMVVGLGKTERSAVNRAIDEVKLSPVNILGVVANGIKSYTTRVYGYYRYYRYYPKHDQAQAAAESAMVSVSSRPDAAPSADYSLSHPASSLTDDNSEATADIGINNPFDYRFDESDSEDDTASDIDTQYQAFYGSPVHEGADDATTDEYRFADGSHVSDSHAPTDDDQRDERPGQDTSIADVSADVYSDHVYSDQEMSDEEYPIHDVPDDEASTEAYQGSGIQGWQYDTGQSSGSAATPVNSPTSPSPAHDPTVNQRITSQSSDMDRGNGKSASRPRTARTSPTSRSWLSGRPTSPSVPAAAPKTETATVHSSSIATSTKILMGLGITLVFGAVGWSLYQRFTNGPSTPPEPDISIQTPAPEASTPVPTLDVEEAVPNGSIPENTPGTEDASAPEDTSGQEPDIPPVTEPGTTGTEAPESPAATLDDATPDDATPELAPEVQDPFAEAVRLAQDAVGAGETANTPEEWSRIADQWQRASALMAIVPQNDERFPIARDRTVLYRNNSEFARQKVLELLSTKDFSADN
jgi:hypothetical protein